MIIRRFFDSCLSRSICVAALAALPACSSSDSAPATGSDASSSFEEAKKELISIGLNKYFGKAKPSAPVTKGDTQVYTFDVADGPECLRGGQYEVFVRDSKSDNLIIYLEGGGACWSGFCQANATAEAANQGKIPAGGILSTDPAVSAVAGWNLVYLPYCDGSVFSGDNEFPNEMPPRYHHGLKNLSAGIDLAKSLYPNPKRIFLAGSSAGGYGTLVGTGVVRLQYETNELMVFNDSGVGLSNPQNPAMLAHIKSDWQFTQYVPPSCTECQTGQETAIIGWSLQHDPTLRVSAFSSYGDSVIAGIFLQMPAADFKTLLLSETGKIHDAYPDRFERFFINGGQHTTLFSLGTAVNGVTVGDWTKAMVNKTSAWVDTLQQSDGGM